MRNILIFLINFVFSLYYVLFLIRAFLPWFPQMKFNIIVKAINKLTDPFLSPIKQGLPPIIMGMDVSPFIAIILFWVIQRLILLFI